MVRLVNLNEGFSSKKYLDILEQNWLRYIRDVKLNWRNGYFRVDLPYDKAAHAAKHDQITKTNIPNMKQVDAKYKQLTGLGIPPNAMNSRSQLDYNQKISDDRFVIGIDLDPNRELGDSQVNFRKLNSADIILGTKEEKEDGTLFDNLGSLMRRVYYVLVHEFTHACQHLNQMNYYHGYVSGPKSNITPHPDKEVEHEADLGTLVRILRSNRPITFTLEPSIFGVFPDLILKEMGIDRSKLPIVPRLMYFRTFSRQTLQKKLASGGCSGQRINQFFAQAKSFLENLFANLLMVYTKRVITVIGNLKTRKNPGSIFQNEDTSKSIAWFEEAMKYNYFFSNRVIATLRLFNVQNIDGMLAKFHESQSFLSSLNPELYSQITKKYGNFEYKPDVR